MSGSLAALLLVGAATAVGLGQQPDPPPPELRFANTFGDHMVLQAGSFVSVWGHGLGPGSAVSVVSTASPSVVTTTTTANNTWHVRLPAVAAGSMAHTVTATSGDKSAALRDVLYGDVWLCSGQSNMQFTMDQLSNGGPYAPDETFNLTAEVAAAAKFPLIRLFTVGTPPLWTNSSLVGAGGELAAVTQPWTVASPDALGGAGSPTSPTQRRMGNLSDYSQFPRDYSHFSAFCWFYGKELHQARGYPIGLIATSYGGTPAEAWSSPSAIEQCYNPPPMPPGPVLPPQANSVLWESMVVPLLRSTIKGVAWWQGEANCGLNMQPKRYACVFPTMIRSWRDNWRRASLGTTADEFPFGFVQLSVWADQLNTTCGMMDDPACSVPTVRWGQTANYGYVPNENMSNTFMAVGIDLGDPNSTWGDIHPRFKKAQAHRLAQGALAIAYQEKRISWRGPIATSAQLVGGNPPGVQIVFNDTGSGLVLKHSVGVEVYQPIAIAPFHVWVMTPIVRSDATSITAARSWTSNISHVRYNWYQAPCLPEEGPIMCAVYADGLPAPPFVLPVVPLAPAPPPKPPPPPPLPPPPPPPPGPLEWYVEPASLDIQLADVGLLPTSSKVIDLAAQIGECEGVQLRLRHDGMDMKDVLVEFSALKRSGGGELPPSTWSSFQVGYVNCTVTDFCKTCSGALCGGWKPDPLLPIPAGGVPLVPSHHTQPIFLEVCVPRGEVAAVAGNYSGKVTVTIQQGGAASEQSPEVTVAVPVSLEVWPIVIPEVNSSESWPMVFSFTPDMEAQYKSWQPGSEIMRTWYQFQTAHRMPADYLYGGDFAENIYQPHPDADFRDPDEYPVLADSGAWGANLLDVPTPGNKCFIQIPQFNPDSGSIYDVFIPRSR